MDANSVYAQTVYDYCDLCVGFRFCNILFRDDGGGIGVDPTLLNDVTEQIGPDAPEALGEQKNKTMADIFIL